MLWLTQAGFLPVCIPNMLPVKVKSGNDWDYSLLDSWLDAIKPSALVLSGGNDIGEYPERDNTEKYLLDWARTHNIPLLAICRGMQLMTHWAGSELKPVKGHVRTRHQLLQKIDDGISLPNSVNSYHNWALSTCPDSFEIMALAEDGEIEAIRHIQLPWEGWMWHPEREKSFNTFEIMRIKRLFGEE